MTTFLVAQFVIYGFGWAVGALFMQEQRRPASLWSLYCIVQAAGMYRVSQQSSEQAGVGAPAAMLMLVAYACAGIGIDGFAFGRARFLPLWAGLLVLGEAFQTGSLAVGMSEAARALSYDLTVAALLFAPIVAVRKPLQREFGAWGLMALLPGALVCVFALVRCALILDDPGVLSRASSSASNNPELLLATLFAAGAFNISFMGLVMGRLVVRLKGLIDTDPLTGLLNRGGLDKQLLMAWRSARRHREALSVAFIDIDEFKEINDRGGHEAGDRVIERVADLLRAGARLSDCVGRWGGDEFLVVMSHTDEAGAQLATQRLLDSVREARVELPPGCARLSLSIGLATRHESDAGFEAMVARADADMYRGKQSRPSARSSGAAATAPRPLPAA